MFSSIWKGFPIWMRVIFGVGLMSAFTGMVLGFVLLIKLIGKL